MNESWIKLHRSKQTMELLKDQNAFVLLTCIALRAKRTSDFNVSGLSAGEALLGDYKNYGMSRQEYRTATNKLEKYGFATFKRTNKGTVARLVDCVIYDINIELKQPSEQPSANHQATTNKNEKNEKNDNKRAIDRKKRGKIYGKQKVGRDFTGNSKIGQTIEV